jgi:ribonucleoside-diphosphate reductase alpha chain
MTERKFIPAGRYLYAAGRDFHQTSNCMSLSVEDSREGWSNLLWKASMALMTGAGVGVEYSSLRSEGAPIRRTGGMASGPVALMEMLNEAARHIQQGGSRRAALWAGLDWSHPDIAKFMHIKNWSEDVRWMKSKNFNYPAPLDMTNISVGLNDEFFTKHGEGDAHALAVFNDVTFQMCRTGEPGLSVNVGKDAEWKLRNACTEFCSKETDNICNLGSINMARIETLEEFSKVVELATLFLYAGSHYTLLPYDAVAKPRQAWRQIGLGLMGMHEWLLKRGYKYGEQSSELSNWLSTYEKNIDSIESHRKGNPILSGCAVPAKGRAIAPAGSIGILGETTTGIEPIFCSAYKRRYLKGKTWHYQYVIDPAAKRLMEFGIPESQIEDAYSLAEDVERRISFQAYVQQYVDMGISSTINLPAWGSEYNNDKTLIDFRRILMKYLPGLRGITCYPDGCRDGQPLQPVKMSTALKHVGEEIVEESMDVCTLTGKGSCGV